MKRRARHIPSRFISDQTGNALILVLIFLLMGSLMLVPALAHVSTALKTGVKYEEKTKALYAADAGVDDAIWQIKYDGLESKFRDANYNYIFSTNASYSLNSTVNGLTTNVTIANVWVPSNVTLADLILTPAQAKDVLERPVTDNTTNRLVLSGTPLDESNYRIKIDFYPAIGVTTNLSVSSIGVWLPHGFTYNYDCNMATFAGTQDNYEETVEDRPGGQAVVWDFSPDTIYFTDLPPEDLDPSDMPQEAVITFKYICANPSTRPNAIGWIVTAGPLSNYAYPTGGGVPITWDVDTKLYKINSKAGGTEVETYVSRCELRNMYVATPGDYVAIGNSLMTDDVSPIDGKYRNHWWASSDAALDSIPTDAYITHAYLYWSGFFGSGFSSAFWTDNCSAFAPHWDGPNKYWQISSGTFRGYKSSSGTDTRYLTMNNSVDLSSYTAGQTIVEWEQESGGTLEGDSDPTNRDRLQFQISSDNGATWSDMITAFCDDLSGSNLYYYYVLPESCFLPGSKFKMRLYLDGFNSSGECAYIDNIGIATITGAADTAVDFTIAGYDTYTTSISALVSQLIGNKYKGQYSYACRQDVTTLVNAHSSRNAQGEPIGNAVYTVGNVDATPAADDYELAYAGWSLVIIYHSASTAGRQLYLWDYFSYCKGNENLDFDRDGSPGGTINGFIVPERIGTETEAAKLTCFVGEGDLAYSGDYIKFNGTKLWDSTTTTGNSQASPNNVWNSTSVGMTKDGVDIDTFHVTWDSGLLHADDTQAQIDLYTQTDNFNLIYIILSVRSKTTIGGTEHYLIKDD